MTEMVDSSPEFWSEVDRLRRRVAALETAAAAREQYNLALLARLKRFEFFAAINPVWFWETDADLRFTYFSPNLRKITGLTPEWHYGKTRAEIGAPGTIDSEAWRAHLETLRKREPFSDFVFQRGGPNGVRWICVNGVPVYDDGAFQGYRGTGCDVTDQVAAKAKIDSLLAAIEELYETFVLWDEDDRLVVCNERFRQLSAAVIETTEPGTKIDDHLRAALAKGLFPEAVGREEEWFEERMRRYRNPGQPFEIERQNGRWILVHEQRVAGGATVTIATDITELKNTARAEREKAAILETALDTIPDGFQVLDRDLNLTIWNEQLFTILGLDRDAVLGAENPRRAFFHMLASRGEYGDGDPDQLVAAREKYIRTMTPVQFVRQLATGTWIEGRGIPIEGGEGYVTVYRDITERRRLDRMQREFVATVSHELRTPLTSIHGSLSLIKKGIEDPSFGDVAPLVDIAHKNSKRLVGLVNDILDLDTIGAGKMDFRMGPISVPELVKNAIELNEGMGAQLGVSFEVKKRLPNSLVWGDADRLMQVLTNLLSNAAKYSPREGVVEISAARRASCVRVSVRDRGPGIPREYHEKIFERFSRVDSTDARKVQGTGLGLYISKAIIDRHNGAIGIDSTTGEGTTFFFEIPLMSDVAA